MDLQLTGRKAVVTGGTRGIGRAVVAALLDEGAHVAFCARTEAEVKETESALARPGTKVLGSALDVADADALRAWVVSAADALGGLTSWWRT